MHKRSCPESACILTNAGVGGGVSEQRESQGPPRPAQSQGDTLRVHTREIGQEVIRGASLHLSVFPRDILSRGKDPSRTRKEEMGKDRKERIQVFCIT